MLRLLIAPLMFAILMTLVIKRVKAESNRMKGECGFPKRRLRRIAKEF